MTGSPARYYVMLAAVGVVWGATPAAGKLLTGALSPLLLTALRFAVISALLFAWLALTRQRTQLRPQRELLWLMLALGFTGVLLHNGLLFLGLHYTTATNTALIESLGPTITAVLACLFLGERLSPWGYAGIAVSCAGALCIITRGEAAVLRELSFNGGDLIILCCEAAWSAYIVMALGVRGRLSTLGVTAWSGLFGSLLCLSVGLVTDSLWVGVLDALAWGCLLYIVLAAGLFAFVAWNWAAEAVGASKAGAFVYLVPLTGAAVGVMVLGEDVAGAQLLGAVLIAAGVAVTAGSRAASRRGGGPSAPQPKQEFL